MTPYFTTKRVTIYNARAEDVLPTLPPGSIDLLLTDPPYGISYRSKSRRETMLKTVENDDDLNALRGALPLIDRLLKSDRHCYVFAAPARIGEAADAIAPYWRIKNKIVWDKGDAGSRGDLTAGYANNWEAIIYANKGRRALQGPRPRAIFRYDWQGSRDPVHPTIKPVEIFRRLISKSTLTGEAILDPFCGTGPSLIAAEEMDRRAVGIELEERYCETAARRLENLEKRLA